jgi:ABC-type transport system involved in multi-copper enzyme maturation permease subunit
LNVWPVVQRELREGARRRENHRLRFWSAVAGTLMLWSVAANSDKPANQLGGGLFACLHTLLLGLIVLIAPALTADCIAREKREGTLGLLFLTPLNAGGIVAGKALVQGLRAFTLWLAVLPILVIPFTLGGVAWLDAFSALSLEFCATMLCLAAGLLASSLARERNTAFLLAIVFAAVFLFFFMQLFLLVLLVAYEGFGVLNRLGWPLWDWEFLSTFSGALGYGFSIGWSSVFAGSTVLGKIWKSLCMGSPLAALLIFLVTARFAAWRIERSWQDKTPSPRRESLLRRYCTPLFQRRYRRTMQRALDWNPIAWLQQYSWKARLGKWGLCLAFVLLESVIVGWRNSERDTVHASLLLTLAGLYTFVGVSGFLEEKRSGALELLLVTPISVNKLIFGRVWGLWKQFLPAGLVLAVSFLGGEWIRSGFDDDVAMDATVVYVMACEFFALPVFATYFALRVKNLLVAAVLTWVALFLPFIFVLFSCQRFLQMDPLDPGFMLAVFFSYAAFALLAFSALRHSLSRRIYSF